jgi:hypothetical protein
MDGGEGVWKGEVDENGLVVEGEREVEEEVEGEPESGRVGVEIWGQTGRRHGDKSKQVSSKECKALIQIGEL